METIIIKTEKNKEVIDLTDLINQKIKELNFDSGICQLNALHTTVGLTTCDLDPGTDLDMLDAYQALIPQLNYRHPHNPKHAPDHIISALMDASLALPIQDKQLLLGTWQRVVLFEFDGPKLRTIILNLIKT